MGTENIHFDSFLYSDEPEPHKQRTKALLKEHPEIRNLIGKNPYTLLIILFTVALQLSISYFVHDVSWWFVFMMAFFIGAFPCHTLQVCIHECAHNLIFKNNKLNILSGILANIPLLIPSSVSFKKYHLKHHSYQGVEELDADMPSKFECVLINNRPFGKALWLLLYPIVLIFRTPRIKEVKLFDFWTFLNIFVEIITIVGISYFLGTKSIVYMMASYFFSVGLHPLGARWIQEHFLTHGTQETKSYYGPLNVVNLNVGYHNEHHDFPSVPWNKLPKVKQIGGHYYNSLFFHTSYTGLLFKFLFSKSISIYSRMARTNRG